MRAHSGGLRPPKYDSGLGESGSPPDECTQMMAPVRCGFATVSPWLLGRRDHVTGKATASSTPECAIGTPPYPACTGRVLPVERPRMQCGPAGLRGRILYSSVCTQCTLRTVRPPVCTPLGNQLNMASRSSTTTWSPSAERVARNTVLDGLISACTVATVAMYVFAMACPLSCSRPVLHFPGRIVPGTAAQRTTCKDTWRERRSTDGDSGWHSCVAVGGAFPGPGLLGPGPGSGSVHFQFQPHSPRPSSVSVACDETRVHTDIKCHKRNNEHATGCVVHPTTVNITVLHFHLFQSSLHSQNLMFGCLVHLCNSHSEGCLCIKRGSHPPGWVEPSPASRAP